MIRVNLAKTHNYTSSGTHTAVAMDQAAGPSGETPHPAAKIAIILGFTIALYFYESYNISQKKAALNVVMDQAARIEEEASEFGAIKNVVEGLTKEKNRLKEQLSVIQKISKKRAFKLKAIRQVQESVLEDLWLSELIVDQNQLIFRGYSRTPTSVQQIVKNLNKADFVRSAINQELKRVKVGQDELNSFDIKAEVRN